MTEYQRDAYGNDDSQQIYAEEDRAAMTGSTEESRNQKSIHRQAGTTAHKGAGHDGDQTVFFIVQCTGSHNTGNVAAKAKDHRYERFPVEAQGTHGPVNEEGCTRSHISRIFQQADE